MGTATAGAGAKTEVFTKEELDALRKALNEGRNGLGAYATPPDEAFGENGDWRNDVELLIKFLRDLQDVLSMAVESRLPPKDQRMFRRLLEGLSPTVEGAIAQLEAIDSPEAGLYKLLEKVGLAKDALLAKLDTLRDRFVEGPLVGALEMGDTILDSLIAAIDILEPLKEVKDTIKNKIEFGADAGLISLNLYPYRERYPEREQS